MKELSKSAILNFLNKQKEILLAIYDEKGGLGLSGQNGPYRDKETGLRAQAHLIVLLSNLDREGKTKIYEKKVNELIVSICESHNRIDKIVFIQREKPGKDEVNGVIGIAWVIEAFCCAYDVYGNDMAKEFIGSVEDSLRFNMKRGLWYRPVLETSEYFNTIDETFNHQLWLAYALVFKSHVLGREVSLNVKRFFKNIDSVMSVRSSGLIRHSIVNKSSSRNLIMYLLKDLKNHLLCLILNKTTLYKENGYHLFNLFAFARVVDLGYDFLILENRGYSKAKKYCLSESLYSGLLKNEDARDFYMQGRNSGLEYNRYGFPYNVSGFEFLYVNKVLGLDSDHILQQSYFNSQLSCYSLTDDNCSHYKTEDVNNLLVRSYELSYIIKHM